MQLGIRLQNLGVSGQNKLGMLPGVVAVIVFCGSRSSDIGTEEAELLATITLVRPRRLFPPALAAFLCRPLDFLRPPRGQPAPLRYLLPPLSRYLPTC